MQLYTTCATCGACIIQKPTGRPRTHCDGVCATISKRLAEVQRLMDQKVAAACSHRRSKVLWRFRRDLATVQRELTPDVG